MLMRTLGDLEKFRACCAQKIQRSKTQKSKKTQCAKLKKTKRKVTGGGSGLPFGFCPLSFDLSLIFGFFDLWFFPLLADLILPRPPASPLPPPIAERSPAPDPTRPRTAGCRAPARRE